MVIELFIEDLNAFYKNLDNNPRKLEELIAKKEVAFYNQCADFIVSDGESRIVRARMDPPTVWQWIFVDGKETASWPIWNSSRGNWSINLTVNNQYYAVNSACEPLPNADVCLERIERMSEAINIRGECKIYDIAYSILQEKEKNRLLISRSLPVQDRDESIFDIKKYHSSK